MRQSMTFQRNYCRVKVIIYIYTYNIICDAYDVKVL